MAGLPAVGGIILLSVALEHGGLRKDLTPANIDQLRGPTLRLPNRRAPSHDIAVHLR